MDRGRLLLHLPDSGSGRADRCRARRLPPVHSQGYAGLPGRPLHRIAARRGASSSRPCRPSWTGWARPPLRGRSRIPAAPWRAAGPEAAYDGSGTLVTHDLVVEGAWHEEPAGHYPLRRGIPAGRRRPAHLLAGSLPGPRRCAELHTLAPLPEPYTQADLDEALALRTEGYEAQSVAAFDRALADWTNEAAFHAREERIRRLLCSYEEDGPEAEFVLGTLAAAMGACSARHYGGYCTQITPAYADAAAYTRSEGRIRRLLRGL